MISMLGVSICLGLSEDAALVESDRVRDVLVAEAAADGSVTDRATILEPQRQSETIDEAWWHSGYMKVDGEWMRYEDAVKRVLDQKTLAEYRDRRDQAETARDLILLANWCRGKGLDHHFRVHKMQALRLDPKIARVKKSSDLGLVDVSGYWLTPSVAARVQRDSEFQRQSHRRFRKVCQTISRKVNGSAARVEEGQARLDEITKPEALPAIDTFIGQRTRKGAEHAVSAFGKVPTVRSSVLLTKYAVFANSPAARSAATRELSDRRLPDFVPLLLKLLSTEIEKVEPQAEQFNPFVMFNSSGRFNPLAMFSGGQRRQQQSYKFENQYRRETQDSIATLKSTVAVNPLEFEVRVVEGESFESRFVPMSWSDARDAAERSTENAIAAKWGRSIEQANKDIRELNERVIDVLSEVSDQSSRDDPKYWWSWWSNRVGTEPREKEIIEVEELEERTAVTRVEVRERSECFAAGTTVLTARGPRPIETVLGGDRVLAQNIETGELEFKVVEQPTVRARRVPTVRLEIGDETIVCTPGHEVWQNGFGWVRAKELRRGDRVRTAKGSLPVHSVRGGRPQLTYNLVVEGHHNYFVTNSALLVHDVNTSTPTDNIAPGLSRFDVK